MRIRTGAVRGSEQQAMRQWWRCGGGALASHRWVESGAWRRVGISGWRSSLSPAGTIEGRRLASKEATPRGGTRLRAGRLHRAGRWLTVTGGCVMRLCREEQRRGVGRRSQMRSTTSPLSN